MTLVKLCRLLSKHLSVKHKNAFEFCSIIIFKQKRVIIIQAIYSNDPYFLNGHQLTTSVIYKDTLVNYYGCDSIVTSTFSYINASVDLKALPDSLIWPGESVTLVAALSNPSDSVIAWSPLSLLTTVDATSMTTMPKNSTWYYVQTKSSDGCVSSDSILISFNRHCIT